MKNKIVVLILSLSFLSMCASEETTFNNVRNLITGWMNVEGTYMWACAYEKARNDKEAREYKLATGDQAVFEPIHLGKAFDKAGINISAIAKILYSNRFTLMYRDNSDQKLFGNVIETLQTDSEMNKISDTGYGHAMIKEICNTFSTIMKVEKSLEPIRRSMNSFDS